MIVSRMLMLWIEWCVNHLNPLQEITGPGRAGDLFIPGHYSLYRGVLNMLPESVLDTPGLTLGPALQEVNGPGGAGELKLFHGTR